MSVQVYVMCVICVREEAAVAILSYWCDRIISCSVGESTLMGCTCGAETSLLPRYIAYFTFYRIFPPKTIIFLVILVAMSLAHVHFYLVLLVFLLGVSEEIF